MALAAGRRSQRRPVAVVMREEAKPLRIAGREAALAVTDHHRMCVPSRTCTRTHRVQVLGV